MYRIGFAILMLISFFLGIYALVLFPISAGIQDRPWFSPIVAAVSFSTLAIASRWVKVRTGKMIICILTGTVRTAVLTIPLYYIGIWFGGHI